MAKCSICGKSVLFGNKVSHSHRRANKMFRPNVKRVRIQTDKGNRRVYVCTSCLRSGVVKRAVVSRRIFTEPESVAVTGMVQPKVIADSVDVQLGSEALEAVSASKEEATSTQPVASTDAAQAEIL